MIFNNDSTKKLKNYYPIISNNNKLEECKYIIKKLIGCVIKSNNGRIWLKKSHITINGDKLHCSRIELRYNRYKKNEVNLIITDGYITHNITYNMPINTLRNIIINIDV